MTKTGKVVVWGIVLILVIWGIVSISKKEEVSTEPIKIGFLGPLSGDTANIGENARAAVQLAVDEVNSSGGVLGRQLEIVYEDDGCNGGTAASAVSKLINTDKVSVILGAACSGATLGAAPVAEAAQVPMLSYCSTNPTVSQAGDYIFRNVPSDSFQANYAAHYLIDTGKKNVALLSTKDDWGDGLNKSFTDVFTSLGGTLVFSDTFDPSTNNLKTQITKIKTKNPDAIYFVGYTGPSIAFVKQAHDLDVKATLFGADAWDDSKIWSEAGTLSDGAMYTVIGSNTSDIFKTAMQAKLGKDDLIYCSNYAFDGVKVIANAIKKADSLDTISIKNALYKTKYSGGVGSNDLSFDANGDPVSANYTIKVIKNGKAEAMVK